MSANTKIKMSFQDRIAQCKQQVINDWESTFLTSVLAYCNSYNFAGLSDKQEKKLEGMEKDFGLSKYLNADGTKPFKADAEGMKVINCFDNTSTCDDIKLFTRKEFIMIGDDDLPF